MKQTFSVTMLRVASDVATGAVLAGLIMYQAGQSPKSCIVAGIIMGIKTLNSRLAPSPGQVIVEQKPTPTEQTAQ